MDDSDTTKQRRADIRKECETDYSPEQYGVMLVDVAGELDEDWVKVLLDLGAEVEARDSTGMTALCNACSSSDGMPMVELLLSKGAAVNVEDKYGYSPLRWAVHYNAPDVCHRLLEAGANVNHRDAKECSILLQAVIKAEYNGWDACLVPLLLKAGADPNVPNKRNQTPLALACKLGLLATVRALLDSGAKVEGASSRTPLMEACSASHLAVVELLLERGADVHGEEEDRFSALMLAASGNDDREEDIGPIVRMLLDAGADVNALRSKGHTALHRAASKKRNSVVQLLLERGADPFVEDEDGKDLLAYAGKFSMEVVRILERAIEA